MKARLLVTLIAIAAVSGALAYAQPVNAKIDFPFVAGDKNFPAGDYEFKVGDSGGGAVIVVNGAAGIKDMLAITYLARHGRDQGFEVVFDKIGGKYYLSEVWFPGKDGFLLLSTKEAHEHAVVGGPNPKK